MGFIKAVVGGIGGQLSDQYREVIRCDENDANILVKKVTTESGVIQNESRLFVQPGQCAIYTDNGAIKDIISEPGMYFMNTSAPSTFQTNIFKGIGQTFLESMKRIAYEGKAITSQAVYFVSTTIKDGLLFGTKNPVMFSDPEWGPMEVRAHGTYAIEITDPTALLVKYGGTNDTVYVSDVEETLTSYLLAGLSTALGSLGVAFDKISSKQLELSRALNDAIDEDLKAFGLAIAKVAIASIVVPEEIQQAVRERAAIKLKSSSVDAAGASIYTQLNTAEAIKDMANNQGGGANGATILGMNVGSVMGGVAGGAVANSYQQPQTQAQPNVGVINTNTLKCPKCGSPVTGKFCGECGTEVTTNKVCPKCGATVTGKFCGECGTQIQ